MGARFPATVQTGPKAHSASFTVGTRSVFPGVKRSGRGINHPPPFSAEVKERVELYLYSPSGPSWSVLVRSLPLEGGGFGSNKTKPQPRKGVKKEEPNSQNKKQTKRQNCKFPTCGNHRIGPYTMTAFHERIIHVRSIFLLELKGHFNGYYLCFAQKVQIVSTGLIGFI